MSTWWEWLWGAGPTAPLRPTDAVHDPTLRGRFIHFLDHTDPPATFKASEVAQAMRLEELAKLGYKTWEEVLPAVIELAFEMRTFGYCAILKKGRVLGEDVSAYDIEGGVRIRRKDGGGGLHD